MEWKSPYISMIQLLSKLFLLLGLFFLASFAYLLYLRYSPHPLTFEGRPHFQSTVSIDTPTRIKIPAINVDTAIFPSIIRNNIWETTGKGVSYLATSPVPGEKGNSVMYGHNWSSILGNLPKTKPGQQVIIYWSDGREKKFEVVYTAEVLPTQRDIIDSTNDTRLTLYTCTGFLDSKRFVVVAKPAS